MPAASPRLVDAAFALVVTAVGVAEIWVPFSSVQGEGSKVATTVGVLICGLALTQRRSHPVAVGVVVLYSWFAINAVTPTLVVFFGQFVPMGIAVFTIARHGRGRDPFVGAAMAAVALLMVDLTIEPLQDASEIVFHWSVFAVVWGFGFGLRRLELRAEDSTRRAVEAEVAAAEQAMAAVVEERTRIARELHDIVAHAVSMMVVQAGAAEQVVDDDPDFTRRALGTIRTTGTSALSEMRRVVAMLRTTDEPGALEPQPGLAAVPALVDDVRSAGLSARLDVAGDCRDLPAGVDLAAYRIVQEALTNVCRHASASAVAVTLTYGPDEVRIEVIDDGVGTAEPTGGHGLVGMRERAALYGGTVDATSVNGTGFSVRAVLPLGSP